MKKILCGLLLATLLSIVMFGNVKQLDASGTIYIRSDGSIDPPDGRIVTDDRAHYCFNVSTIQDSIVVERKDIVIDGAGHVLEGMATGTGMSLSNMENVTIRNMTIKTFEIGIYLGSSSICSICESNVTMCFSKGISLVASLNNHIDGNNISLNGVIGIDLVSSSNNSITGNNIEANKHFDIYLSGSVNTTISGNRIADTGLTISGGRGIYVSSSRDSNIVANNLSNNHYGIDVDEFSKFNSIARNTIFSNDDGVVLSGSNNTVSGNSITGAYTGIWLSASSANTVSGNMMEDCHIGVYVTTGSHNSISENSITNNYYGIAITGSSVNYIFRNNIRNGSLNGIVLESDSSANLVLENRIADSRCGIQLDSSSDNLIYHNSLLNSTKQAYVQNSANLWDNGSSGNYWSDYEGTGEPYSIDANNIDHYPLRVPFGLIPVFWEQQSFDCLIVGNVTVARINVEQGKLLSFKTIGRGYVNLTIPREYSDGFFKVFVDDTQTPCISTCDNTYTSVYFECMESGSHTVRIEAQMKFLGDITGDGQVNIIDIAIVAKHFGQKISP